MRIPVFVSRPSTLNERQEASCEVIYRQLQDLNLEPRTLGRSDYPTEYPLREVYGIAKHCSGGVVLGFEQFYSPAGIWKQGTASERKSDRPTIHPSPWNHLEAGILFAIRLPLLISRETDIVGGIFDNGVSDVFVHDMPHRDMGENELRGIRDVVLKWQALVRAHYYRWELGTKWG